MKENDNNFEALLRLLALKRHETPPPGYFNNFSSQVLARIRAGQTGKPEGTTRWYDEAPWLLRILEALHGKPVFAGTFASALFLLLVFGVVYAEHGESAAQPLMQLSAQTAPFSATPEISHPVDASLLAINNSTNPVLSAQATPAPSLFDQIQYSAQPASFQPLGNQ